MKRPDVIVDPPLNQRLLDISVDAETDTFVIDESDHDISGIELDDSSEEAGSLIAVVNKLTTNRTLLRITKQTSLPPHFN